MKPGIYPTAKTRKILFYDLSFDDGKHSGTGKLPRPAVLPEPGMKLVVKTRFWTPGEKEYRIGDKMTLIARTDRAPHFRTSSLGNWLVKDRHNKTGTEDEAVWSNIEYMLHSGFVEILQ